MEWLAIAGEAALRSVALALVAGVGIKLLRVRHARLEKRLWSAVLVVACGMPVAMLGRWPQLTLTAYPAQGPLYVAHVPVVPAASGVTARQEVHTVPHVEIKAGSAAPVRRTPWRQALVGAYLLVVAAMLCRMFAGLLAGVRLWRKAEPFVPAMPLDGAARVRVSDALQSPVTFGRGVLLPREAMAWSEETLRAVLLHEETHVAEGDFYLQLAATLHLAVFPFSPLAWWLPGKLTQLSEMVCDRAAVAGMDGASYAELLLRFSTGQRLPVGVTAMARSAGVAERVERVLADPQMGSYFRERRGQMTTAATALVVLSAVAMATLHIVRPARLVLAEERVAAPVERLAVQASVPVGSHDVHGAIETYAIYGVGDDGNMVNHGAHGAIQGMEDEHRQHPGAAVWFENDGRAWVIDDKSLVAEAEADYASVRELGRAQGELGRQQGELGSRQGQIASQQGALGTKQGEIGAEMGRVAAQHTQQFKLQIPSDFGADVSALANVDMKLAMCSRLSPQLSAEERASLQKQQLALQAKVQAMGQKMQATTADREAMEREMEAAGKQMQEAMQPFEQQMATLGRQQGELGGQQAKLAVEQEALGARQSSAIAEADRKLQALLGQALRDGKARPVR